MNRNFGQRGSKTSGDHNIIQYQYSLVIQFFLEYRHNIINLPSTYRNDIRKKIVSIRIPIQCINNINVNNMYVNTETREDYMIQW